MKTFLARLGHGLLDLVYPPICLVCGDRMDTGTLCERCITAFVPLANPVCVVCGRPQESRVCGNCERFRSETGTAFAFDAARAGAVYGGAVRHAIHLLKYRNKENVAEPLAAFLADRLVAGVLLPDVDAVQIVVPVPMHRARERGYNQARLLAAPVAAHLGVALLADAAFVRVRATAPQVGQTDKARRANIAAFAVPEPDAVRGKHVLLIDDVYTTGATLHGCAAALKTAGARTVRAVCLAAGG